MNNYINLREVQLAQVEMLDQIVKFIDENKLRYSLDSGTLIGAIRHKGFIPWDDDIDIMMPRPDYDKFIKLYTQKNPYNNLLLCCPENNTTFQPFCKIVDKNIQIIDESVCDQETRYLWIDIFPIDGLPENNKEIKRIYKKISFYNKMLYIHQYKTDFSNKSEFFKNLFRSCIRPFSMFIDANTVIKLATKYDFNKCKYVKDLVWPSSYKIRIPREDFDEYIDVEFEGRLFKSIKNYDNYLRMVYGDYMQLPPEDKRVCHNIKAWRV